MKLTIKPRLFAVFCLPSEERLSVEPHPPLYNQRRLVGLDQKIIALYARVLSTRDIQAELEETYGIEISPTLISHVTDRALWMR